MKKVASRKGGEHWFIAMDACPRLAIDEGADASLGVN